MRRKSFAGYRLLQGSVALAAILFGFSNQASALPSERLLMPYACSLERGRLMLEPGPERTYTIVGRRAERAYTYCPPGKTDDCRTMMVHRFSISCAGQHVPWVRVVAALKSVSFGRTWRQKGHLTIERAAAPAESDAEPCKTINAAARKASKDAATGADCLPWTPAPARDRIVIPEGYAPVGEFGARILFASTTSLAAGLTGREAGQLRLVRYSEPVEREGLPPLGDAELAEAPGPKVMAWTAVVEPHGLADGEAEEGLAGGFVWSILALVAAAATAAAGVLAVRWLSREKTPPRAARTSTGDTALDNAIEQVATLLNQTSGLVAALKPGLPLKDVLEQETALVGQRLSALGGSDAAGGAASAKSAALLRAMIRDLERVRRIAESARGSLEAAETVVRIPQTKSEAYVVLGVNPDVSDGILKKIVDGLRMTWHPDHARDDQDRSLREDRIKQINIAWELINGKRQVA